MYHISLGDFTDPRVVDLLRHHAATARAQTAGGCAHALDVSALQAPDIALWTLWNEAALQAIGALKRHSPVLGEIKSMHTAQAARRQGAARAMLRHIIAEARSSGLERLSLETGSWPYFEPAMAL